jgi:acetyl esterase/lipase
MNPTLYAMRTLAWFALGLVLAVTLVTVASGAAATPKPPQQPLHGPGGAEDVHAGVVATEVKDGAEGWWLFTPSDPVPQHAPVVVFCHGWGGMNPRVYRAWIDHIVRRGNIVIYPLYQDSLRTHPDDFLPNTIAALKDAFAALERGDDTIRPDLDRVAVVGHSAGGVLAAEVAATGAAEGLPAMRAAMPVEPGDGSSGTQHRAMIPLVDLAPMPRDTLLLVVVGADDHLAGETLGVRIYDEAHALPATNRNLIELESDDHGSPALVANHAAPSAFPAGAGAWTPSPQRLRVAQWLGGGTADLRNAGAVDAMDWYGTWKLFDALTDAAFYGTHRDVALGGSTAQTSMGVWSDGVPVKPMRVLK